MMNDVQLLRYARQIMLGGCDFVGQQALIDARIAIVGAGGLGSPVALYLSAAGIGFMRIIDDDDIELSNLQRQIAFSTDDLGLGKAATLGREALHRNPDLTLEVCKQRLSADNAGSLLSNVDLIVDCCDNYHTRFLINDFALQQQVPVVFGAATAWQGQVFVMDPRQEHAACFACFNPARDELDSSCALNGVLGPLVGLIGSAQAIEVTRLILGRQFNSAVKIFDASEGEWHRMVLTPRADCECRQRQRGL